MALKVKWIHEHESVLSPDKNSILVKKGEVFCVGEVVESRENIDEWQINILNWEWDKLTQRNWIRWEIKRKDHEWNHLWDYRRALSSLEANRKEDYKEKFDELAKEIKGTPKVEKIRTIYVPPVPHESLQEIDDEFNVFRILVDGVVIRFVEEDLFIQVTIEGDISQDTLQIVKKHILKVMSQLENEECTLERF